MLTFGFSINVGIMRVCKIDKIKKIIVKQIIGSISELEKQELDTWLLQSEEHEKLFEKITSGEFINQAITDDNVTIKRDVWRKIDRRISKKRSILMYRHLIRVAAVVLIFLGVGFYYMMRKDISKQAPLLTEEKILPGKSMAILELAGGRKIVLNNDSVFRLEAAGSVMVNRRDTLDISGESVQNSIIEYHTIRIPRGGEYVAKLSEGTVVCLNAESELRVPSVFDADSREVYFSGEGYFSVAQDSNRPFIVHVNGLDIRVLGTEFVLRSYRYEKEMVTTLVKGVVDVIGVHDSCRLFPDYQARISKDGKIGVRQVDVYRYLAWKKGRMVLENERLETIMDELSRWYDVNVSYCSPDLKDLRFTMDIKKYSNLDEFISLMEKMNKIFFRIKNKTIVVEKL